MSRSAVLASVLVLLALSAPSCHQAIFTAPPGSTISLMANPGSISAYGGVSVITAFIVEPAGTLVPDGTVVQFFTTLGQIERQGKTNDGIARVNLVSDSHSGKASVQACSGGNPATTASGTGSTATAAGAAGMQCSASIEVAIGNTNVSRIVVTANPSRILFAPRQSQIVANVYDGSGNPVANAPVVFSVTKYDEARTPSRWEWLESLGNPVFTDNNGRAYDTLLTTYPADEQARWVLVTATAGAGTSGTVSDPPAMVQIN
jgi:hypothetical protein